MNRFGAYEILHELKSGGMGAVLLGRRRGPGAFEQLVAIKTIRAEHASSPAVRAMFLDEAAILARLGHPSIAAVHDFGEEGGTLYMVMEYVAGVAFRELVELRPPPLIIARAVAEAARGLHAAHEARDLSGAQLGLVHRDISPDNLMLGFDGHVKVIDFGIALVKNRQAPVTEFGTLKGKPPYMSPEQIKNEPIDRRSDVFSLAVVAWEMLTGRELFAGDSIYSIAYAIENKNIAPPSRVRGDELPIGLDAVVLNALDRELARRTPSAARFAEELEEVARASARGETLATWTERALAARRDHHRAWLASIVAGGQPLPRAVGRPTSQVTEIANAGDAQVIAAIPAVAPVTDVAGEAVAVKPPTSVGQDRAPTRREGPRELDSRLEVVRPRRIAPLVVLLVLLLAGGGAGVYFATQHAATVRAPDAAVRVADAAVRPPDAAVREPDAAVVIPVPLIADAGVRDAGHLRTVHVHADAAVHVAVAARPDAPPAVQGTAYLTAKHQKTAGASFLDVIVDGKKIGITPMLAPHKLSAGHHKLQLADPASGAIVVDRDVDLVDGQTYPLEP